MRNFFLPLWGLMILASFFFSCASTPKTSTPGAAQAELPPEDSRDSPAEAAPPAQGEVSIAVPPEPGPDPAPAVLLEPVIRVRPGIPPLTILDAPPAAPPEAAPPRPLPGTARPRPLPETAPPGRLPETAPPGRLPETAPPESAPGPALAALPPEARPPEARPRTPPERLYPQTPERILSAGQIPFSGLASFVRSINPAIDPVFIEELAHYYIEEAAHEGVNHDVAFAQMCLETGFLRFGGLVTPDMNNFCGLGAIDASQQGAHFPSPQIGARAHIQHLKAYATDAPLRQELVDPRYRLVRYGSAPTLDGLAGSWAADRDYSRKIRSILERLYAFALTPPEPAGAPVQSAEAQPAELQPEKAEAQANEALPGGVQADKAQDRVLEPAARPVPTAETLPESAARPVSAAELIPNRPAQSGGS